MNVQNISKFVKRVNKLNLVEGKLSINVYYSENGAIKPLSDISKDEKMKHIDLLYLKNKETEHYCWIKDLWKLIGKQISKDRHKRYLSKMCLHNFPSEKIVTDYKKYCNKSVKTILPSEGANGLAFKNYNRSIKVPFAIYTDFESVLKEIKEVEKINEKIQELREKQEKLKKTSKIWKLIR